MHNLRDLSMLFMHTYCSFLSYLYFVLCKNFNSNQSTVKYLPARIYFFRRTPCDASKQAFMPIIALYRYFEPHYIDLLYDRCRFSAAAFQ